MPNLGCKIYVAPKVDEIGNADISKADFDECRTRFVAGIGGCCLGITDNYFDCGFGNMASVECWTGSAVCHI